MDHAEARTVFARIVAGALVPKEDEERALAHGTSCADCGREFGADLPASADASVDPDAVFDRALTTALRTHPEGIGRARAAEQLASRGRASPAALAALEDAALRDVESRVRDAARRALEALGGARPAPPRPPGQAPA